MLSTLNGGNGLCCIVDTHIHTTHNILTFVPYHFVFSIWTFNPSSLCILAAIKNTLAFFLHCKQMKKRSNDWCFIFIYLKWLMSMFVYCIYTFWVAYTPNSPFHHSTTMNPFNLLTIYFFRSSTATHNCTRTHTIFDAYSNIVLPYIFHSVNFKASPLPFLLPINFLWAKWPNCQSLTLRSMGGKTCLYEINFQNGRNKSTKAMHRWNSIDVLKIDVLQKSQNFELPLIL